MIDLRLRRFLGCINSLVAVKILETKTEPVSGVLAKTKRLIGFKSGWREIRVHDSKALMGLIDMAQSVKPDCIPENMMQAAQSFLDALGDPDWVEYQPPYYTYGPNATKNQLRRNFTEISELLYETGYRPHTIH